VSQIEYFCILRSE